MLYSTCGAETCSKAGSPYQMTCSAEKKNRSSCGLSHELRRWHCAAVLHAAFPTNWSSRACDVSLVATERQRLNFIYCSGGVWFDQIRLGDQQFGWAGWGLEKVKALEALVQEALFSNAGHFTSNTAFSEGTRSNSIRWCSYKWQLSYHKRPTLVQLNILVFLGLMLKRCLFSSDSFFRNSSIACDTGYFYISHCLSCYPSIASFTCHTMKAVIWPLASAIDHVLLIQAQQTVP